jgi:hypothetical protein
MITGLLMLMAAPAAAAEAQAPETAAEAAGPADEVKACQTPYPDADDTEIVVCVERQQGYRIDPDISEAKRQANRRKLKRPERFADRSCASVGGHGCGTAGINVVAAAVTAVEMARRAVTGGNVGEMFITEPQPDEYQLYLQAKREREAKKEAEAAKLKAEADERARALAAQTPGKE